MNIKFTRTLTKMSFAAATTLVAVGANAATWDFSALPTSPTSSFSVSNGGVGITLSAYYATSTSSAWSTATFRNFDPSGFGITSGTESTTAAPQHAVDSIGNTDIVVIDAGVGTVIDWTSLTIGYGYDTYVGGTPGTSGQYTTGQADIKLWAVNSLGSNTISGLGGESFLSNVTTNSARSIDSGTGGNLSPSRYLVIAGDVNDAFKLKGLAGSPGNPPNQTPEPASMALLGLGLLGLGLARRRKAKA